MALGVRGFWRGGVGGREEGGVSGLSRRIRWVGLFYRVVLWVVVRILHYRRSVWGCIYDSRRPGRLILRTPAVWLCGTDSRGYLQSVLVARLHYSYLYDLKISYPLVGLFRWAKEHRCIRIIGIFSVCRSAYGGVGLPLPPSYFTMLVENVNIKNAGS